MAVGVARDAGPLRRLPGLGYAIAAGIYLLGGLIVMWHAWSVGPTSTTVTPEGDPGLFIWALAYAAKGVAHLNLPLTTQTLYPPTGFNLLAETTALGIGVIFAPVTWIAGPTASLNLALTLAPVASGLAMVYALRRHRAWWPAAIVGGGIWALGPFAVYSINAAWLMVAVLATPPLVWAFLHELFVTRERNPYVVGALLACVLVIQFFIGTEILAVTCTMAAIVGLAVLAVQAATAEEGWRAVLGHAGRGLGLCALVAGLLLAYPAWWAIKGPAHLGTWVWPSGLLINAVVHLHSYFGPVTRPHLSTFINLNPRIINNAYLGIGVPSVIVLALVVAWRNLVLWLLAVLALFGVVMAKAGSLPWSPYQLTIRLPLLRNVLPERWMGIAIFAAAMAVGIAVTELVAAVRRHRPGLSLPAGWGLLGLAVVPLLLADAAAVPLAVGPVTAPAWFHHHRPGTLMMTPSGSTNTIGLTWEAQAGLPDGLLGGWGPRGVGPPLSVAQRHALFVLFDATRASPSFAWVTPGWVATIRRSARQWNVSNALAATPLGIPVSWWDPSGTVAVGLFTEAFGPPTSSGHRFFAWHLGPQSTGLVVDARFSRACNAAAGKDAAKVIVCLRSPQARADAARLLGQ